MGFLSIGPAAALLFLAGNAVVSLIAWSALNLAALAAVAFQVLRHGSSRRGPWRLLLAAFTCYTVSSIPWLALPVSGHPLPFPSLIDAGLFLSYTLFGAALMSLARRYRGQDARASLDILIVAIGVGTPLWEFVLKPEEVEGSWLVTVTLFGYPIALLFLLSLTIRLALLVDRLRVSMLLLLGWIAGELGGDVYYAVSTVNDTFRLDSPYLLFFLVSWTCLGAAALHPESHLLSDRRPARVLAPRPRLLLLGTAVLLPVVVLAVRTHNGWPHPGYLVVVTGVLLLLLLTRLSALMVDLAEQQRVGLELESLTGALRHQAFHDPLTGLANRALFTDRIDHALGQRPQAAERGAAVLMVDLDGLKEINDSLGHDVGDRVLVAVAEQLGRVPRQGDTVARLGGDEFALLLPDLEVREAVLVAERVIAALGEPLHLGTHSVPVTASVGLVVADGSQDRSLLLKQADVAMYAAKTQQRGGLRVFSPELHAAVLERHALSTELKGAASRGELRLDYQPVIDLATHRMVGVEALVRWAHPERGLLPPLQFIPLAEANGYIRELGDWVLEEACRQSDRWALEHPAHPALDIAVNLSPRQLDADDVIERIAAVLERTGVDPRRVVLEVTESALAEDTEGMIRKLVRLKSLGVQIALDDFGTGFSSLSVLRRLPLDIIKIDRTFVAGIAREPEEWAVTTAIIALATSLGKRTLAEGIELGEQLAHLRALQCELGQGYLFDRPLPPDALAERLALASLPMVP